MLNEDFDPDADRRLATLFDIPGHEDDTWHKHELGAVLRHQLRTPLQYNNPTIIAGPAAPRAPLHHPRSSIESFSDLLLAPEPPAELIQLMKDYGKVTRTDKSVPVKVATVLYYTALALALTHGHHRITELDHAAIREGIEWALAQPWLDELTRPVLEEGLRSL